jgi:hypothetical protein
MKRQPRAKQFDSKGGSERVMLGGYTSVMFEMVILQMTAGNP